MSQDLGKTLVLIGFVLVLTGLAVIFKDRLPGFDRIGQLPGDISIEKENFKFYFPLTTSILVSILLSAVFWLLSKFR